RYSIMFNPDLKKMLENVNSRYSLVVGTAKRAREIREEAIENEKQLDEKTVSIAMEEIWDGKYVIEEPDSIKSK
ncbi:DNA-directed RNA polymerase subunit omega, partial [Eubacterium sp.]|uniref:DNA-directed RNA polymerase subunit omega n=1 Tax=Eubacterium sp. TaxID=142586 RepID=UPI004025E45B